MPEVAEAFRRCCLERFVREGWIDRRQARKFLGWKHSGFNLDAAEVPVAADGREGRRAIAEYLLRAPYAIEKLTWNAAAVMMLFRSARNWRTKRNFQVFSGPQFLAALARHHLPKSFPRIRYHGRYSNRARGDRAKRKASPEPVPEAEQPVAGRRRRPWVDLLRSVWGVDALHCPCCGGRMRRIAVIEDRKVIEKILRHLGLWEEAQAVPSRAPPGSGGRGRAPPPRWVVSRHDGLAYDADAPSHLRDLPTDRRYRKPREAFRTWPRRDADPVEGGERGAEARPMTTPVETLDDGLLLLLDGDATPPHDEPVFWLGP